MAAGAAKTAASAAGRGDIVDKLIKLWTWAAAAATAAEESAAAEEAAAAAAAAAEGWVGTDEGRGGRPRLQSRL